MNSAFFSEYGGTILSVVGVFIILFTIKAQISKSAQKKTKRKDPI